MLLFYYAHNARSGKVLVNNQLGVSSLIRWVKEKYVLLRELRTVWFVDLILSQAFFKGMLHFLITLSVSLGTHDALWVFYFPLELWGLHSMLFKLLCGHRIELSLELRLPPSLVLLSRYANDILGPLLLCPLFLFGGPCRPSLLPGLDHQLLRPLHFLLVSPISLDLSCDVLDALLKSVYLACLVSLTGRSLLNLLLQVLLVPAQYPFMLLHLLIVVHEIHLHLK